MPICTIKIPLLPPEGKDVTTPGITQGIANIADAQSSLEAKGVSTLICLKADGSGRLASADVTRSVASVIHEVDCAPGFSMTSSALHPVVWKTYSRNHLKALGSARHHLQGLWISEATTPQLTRASMCLVAGFTNLKKLVLQMALESPDLSPLTQLTCLEEISVVVAGLGNCTELIRHHRHALTHISLSAETWEKSTLRAVSDVTSLQKLVINIQYLSFRSAAIIAGIQRPHSIHVVLRVGAGLRALRVLSSPDCKVTDLTMRAFTPAMLQQVGTMHLLTSLTLVQCMLEGTVLRFQPNVMHLTLMDCSQADDSVISCIVSALPALGQLTFDSKQAWSRLFQPLSVQSLVSVSQARHLSSISLRAVRGLSLESVAMLELQVRAQQEIGMASRRVHVVLPASVADNFGRQEFDIDCSEYPIFCDWKSGERQPSVVQHFMDRIAKPVRSWLCRKAPVCKHIFQTDPCGCVVAAGIVGIQAFCFMPSS